MEGNNNFLGQAHSNIIIQHIWIVLYRGRFQTWVCPQGWTLNLSPRGNFVSQGNVHPFVHPRGLTLFTV
jgi:hypothetical protein